MLKLQFETSIKTTLYSRSRGEYNTYDSLFCGGERSFRLKVTLLVFWVLNRLRFLSFYISPSVLGNQSYIVLYFVV